MKAIAENHALKFRRSHASHDPSVDGLLLAKLGYDLRAIYDDTASAEPPEDLLTLAAAVEAKLLDGTADD